MDRLFRVAGPVEGEDHVVGVEGVAVVEGHAFTQLDGVFHAIFRDVPAFRQIALGDQRVVDMHEAAQHVGRDLELQHLVDLGGVKRDDFADAGPGAIQFATAVTGGHRGTGAQAGQDVGQGQRTACRQEAERCAAADLVAANVVAGQAVHRVARIEIIGVFQLVHGTFVQVFIGHLFLPKLNGSYCYWSQNRPPCGRSRRFEVRVSRGGIYSSRSGIGCGTRSPQAG